MASRRAALLALCLAMCAAHGVLAIEINTPADFLEANSDEFQCMWALLERGNLVEAMTMPELSNTYFFPSDAAFITDLAQTIAVPAGDSTDNPDAGSDLTVDQVVAMIDAMPVEAAVQFIKAHVSPTNYPSVSTMAFPNGVPAQAVDPFGDPVSAHPTIKNSLEEQVSVVYEAAFHALHLDVSDTSGEVRSSAYVAGPAAVPVGESTLYILLNILGDPMLLTDSGVQAQAVASGVNSGNVTASSPDSWF